MLKSLHITNFRCFPDLKLDGFGKVNLIVGPNSSGKTALLEAIRIAANSGELTKLPQIFRNTAGLANTEILYWFLRNRKYPALLKVSNESNQWEILLKSGILDVTSLATNSSTTRKFPVGFPDGHVIYNGENPIMTVTTIPVSGLDGPILVDSFDRATKSASGEHLMEDVLKKVDPRIRALRINLKQNRPFIAVDLGLPERVPLSQAGEGIVRLVTIFSELLNDQAKICLIDEIETGIHYLALKQVWMGLAEIAETRDIQIFATTHSGECIEAAHEAFADRKGSEYDLRVIQLYPVGDHAEGRVLERELIETGIGNQVDLR